MPYWMATDAAAVGVPVVICMCEPLSRMTVEEGVPPLWAG